MSKVNHVVYWGRPTIAANPKRTPRQDAIYFATFFNTKDGPIVVDLPSAEPSATSNPMVSIWQTPLRAGSLLGADRGAGGRYLILPPGFSDEAPEGYIELRSDNFGACAFVRAPLASSRERDVEAAIEYGKKMMVYRLAQSADPPSMIFTDVSDLHPRRRWARRAPGSRAMTVRTFELMFPLYAPTRKPFEETELIRDPRD